MTSSEAAVYLRCTKLYYKDNTGKVSASPCTNWIVEQQTYIMLVALILMGRHRLSVILFDLAFAAQ